MTYSEGVRKVLMLMDEYSSGGTVSNDEDIALRMPDLFDLAQKQVAGHLPVLATKSLTAVSGNNVYDLPKNFVKVYRAWSGTRGVTSKVYVRGNKLWYKAKSDGDLELEYIKTPDTIPMDVADDYEFELREDACTLLPYYVAAMQLMTDLLVDYTPLMGMYNNMLANLDTELPGSQSETVVRQTFYNRED